MWNHVNRLANSWISTIVLTETSVCIVERWKNAMRYRFVPENNNARESRACHFFLSFLSAIFAGTRFVEKKNKLVTWQCHRRLVFSIWWEVPTSTIVAWVRGPGSTHFVCGVFICFFVSGYPCSFQLSSKTNMSKLQFHVESITNLKDRASLRASGSSVLEIDMCHPLWTTCKVVRQTVCKSVILLSR